MIVKKILKKTVICQKPIVFQEMVYIPWLNELYSELGHGKVKIKYSKPYNIMTIIIFQTFFSNEWQYW